MEPELKKNGALYEDVYRGFSFVFVRVSDWQIYYSTQFSDMIRELGDADTFPLKPNESNAIKDHFLKVGFY